MLELTGVHAGYDGRTVLRGIDLAVGDGEVAALLGPSGAGKTTLLRVVAGLERPTGGLVRIDGRDVTDLPAHERRIGLVPQSLALFPHLTVAGNVAFGPRMRSEDAGTTERLVTESLELVDLAGQGGRDVTTLSGGEQQRVALARAIASRPRLLLLDEPLGSLDRVLRRRLLDDLPTLFARLGVTVLTVTHDQDEALALADRVAVLLDGRVAGTGTPEALWDAPGSVAVARFLGVTPLVPVDVLGGLATTPFGTLAAPVADGPWVLAGLGGALVPAPDGAGRDAARMRPLVTARVVARRFAGVRTALTIELDGTRFRLDVDPRTRASVGAPLDLVLDATRLVWLAPEDGA